MSFARMEQHRARLCKRVIAVTSVSVLGQLFVMELMEHKMKGGCYQDVRSDRIRQHTVIL